MSPPPEQNDIFSCCSDLSDNAPSPTSVRPSAMALRENGFLKDGKSLHDMTLARQRAWLAQRERACGGMQGDKIGACVAGFMRMRNDEFDREAFDRAEGVPPDGLTLGTEKLVLAKREDGETPLLHDGKAVIDGFYGNKQPFMILQHWNSKETSAALIGAELWTAARSELSVAGGCLP
jgi:hypothetical protein